MVVAEPAAGWSGTVAEVLAAVVGTLAGIELAEELSAAAVG